MFHLLKIKTKRAGAAGNNQSVDFHLGSLWFMHKSPEILDKVGIHVCAPTATQHNDSLV